MRYRQNSGLKSSEFTRIFPHRRLTIPSINHRFNIKIEHLGKVISYVHGWMAPVSLLKINTVVCPPSFCLSMATLTANHPKLGTVFLRGKPDDNSLYLNQTTNLTFLSKFIALIIYGSLYLIRPLTNFSSSHNQPASGSIQLFVILKT